MTPKTSKFEIDWDLLELTDEEKAIQEAFADQEPLSGEEFEKRKKELMQQAKNSYEKRTKKISLRIKTADLEDVKVIAEEDGLPYQTLIGSIVHQRIAKRKGSVNTTKKSSKKTPTKSHTIVSSTKK